LERERSDRAAVEAQLADKTHQLVELEDKFDDDYRDLINR